MKILKILLIFFEMLIFAAGATVIGWIIFPILSIRLRGCERRKAFANIVRKSWQIFVKIMEKTNIVRVYSDENLGKIRSKIVVASHPSFLDIVFLISLIPNSLCLAKKELLFNPFMRNIVKSLYIINDLDTEVFKKSAKEALDEGFNIIIFPTGTRTLPSEKLKIHKGAALLAIANDINIVPIKIELSFPFFAKHSSPFRVSEVPVDYNIKMMSEIDVESLKKEFSDDIKLRNHISEIIKNRIN